MIEAKEAYRKTIERRNEILQFQLKNIKDNIEKAIQEGKFFISFILNKDYDMNAQIFSLLTETFNYDIEDIILSNGEKIERRISWMNKEEDSSNNQEEDSGVNDGN